MVCTTNETGVCATLQEVGEGIGGMTDAMRLPLGKFILFLAIIGAVVALILGIVYAIKGIVTKNL